MGNKRKTENCISCSKNVTGSYCCTFYEVALIFVTNFARIKYMNKFLLAFMSEKRSLTPNKDSLIAP